MPKAAAKRFYDQQVPLSVERVLRKLSREARTEFPELQDVEFVDGQPVKGLRITPELREALIQNGLPSFRDGGMVSDQTSRVGRPLYENPDGSYYSEVTVTFPFEGKWLTFPSVDESGNILSEDEVFDYVKYLKNQDNFSKWASMDPDMQKTYRGTDVTVGFVSAWASDNPDVGVGEQEIKAITAGQRIDFELRFITISSNRTRLYDNGCSG